jgi:23S rRNA pseudouridine1911/1915/1917 synthase
MREPEIQYTSKNWIIVYKPHGMPTAPLLEDEPNTLMYWIIQRYPEVKQVIGRKKIEYGLIHRLDTPTDGLVLIALSQSCYDYFFEEQKNGNIEKYYTAHCDTECNTSSLVNLRKEVPKKIVSKFKKFGPRGKEVRPLFEGMRGYKDIKAQYETTIQRISIAKESVAVECSLVQGFRHQIRTHLAYLGLPIQGDELYNKKYIEQSIHKELQLTAHTIIFTDPDSGLRKSFSLLQQDKTIQ